MWFYKNPRSPFAFAGSIIARLLSAFKSRVAADSGTFEAESCLNTNLTSLVNSGLYEKASLIVTPNAYKASKIYSLKPTGGSGDLTFARSSAAIRRNSVGLLESIASSVPRLFHPIGGGCPAWLLEPQRTNAITQSNNFLPLPGDWYDFNGMVPVANSATDPFGANNGWLFSSTAAFSRQYGLSISTAIGDVVTMSVFVKKSTSTTIRLRIQQSVNATYIASATYNLDTNTITAGTGTIENYGNGWYRLSVTGTTTVVSSGLRPFLDGLNGNLFVFGFQAELGPYATSYNPTTTSAVTRVADSYTRPNGSTFGFVGNQATFIYDFTFQGGGGVAQFVRNDESSGSGHYWQIHGNISGQVAVQVVRGFSVLNSYNLFASTTLNQRVKICGVFNGTNYRLFINSVKVVDVTLASAYTFSNGIHPLPTPDNVGSLLTHLTAFIPESITDLQGVNATT